MGGTWIRVVLSDKEGKFIERAAEQVDITNACAISGQIVRIVRSLCDRHKINAKSVRGVGIASAGPLMLDKGVLLKPPNIPYDLVPLTKPVSEQLGVPVCLINDCVGAALGEKKFGAAQGLDNFVYITISTGIGCGAIVNGTLLLGKDGNSHEVGHFVIDYAGRLICGCGRPGHWEGYCSGRNIPNYVRMRLEQFPEGYVKESLLYRRVDGNISKLVAADLFAAASGSDGLSLTLVNEIGVLNAVGFATVINAYDPSLITVGGTVTMKNRNMVLLPIRKHVGEYAINRVPKIAITPLGYDVVLYGGVATAMKYLS